ncbi:sodium:calcium antiporter [Novosphingobium mangrovi (ex Huang et al. 2023)]|uniref:Sodium:calcium antiporter n=1 Tax=Novosphingobium mangrovi (ex Huang et al. 2023) TaxID=2976432 RepID=A0ABT2I4W5_9SPHN|nr:sodium:calcium antiporter [Novosphingobium mangrovi (ex Huang et al. 2023)]MCT2399851.1 sodium:calcium antiporter [Novosphingobium mangrovi (ex Huang et al. 2023)]
MTTAALLPWLGFALCSLLIGRAGYLLTHYGEAISRRTTLSHSWVGLILLATATSLPELFTGVSSVAIADAPNIAVGDALGSCVINLVMLAVLDVLSRDSPVYHRFDQGHILTAGFGVILIGFVGALIIVARDDLNFMLGHVSLYTPFLIVFYLVGMRSAFFYERRQPTTPPDEEGPETALDLRGAIWRYLGAAAVIAAAGAFLPVAGTQIAEVTGWHKSFVGTLFIAATTSLPEAAVTISALRRNAPNMAIGALLGSNMFDILVIAVDDLAYTRGSLLANVSPAHAVTAFAGCIMSGIVIVALLYRPGNRFFGWLGWVSLSLLAVFLLSSYAIYLHEH